METFTIEIEEVLSKRLSVDAESLNDAIFKVQKMYCDEEIVLSADNHVSTEISPAVDDSIIQKLLEEKKDEREILERILCLIGIPENKASLIAIEAGCSQTVVNRDYLIEIGVSSFLIPKSLNYIHLFYDGELSSI